MKTLKQILKEEQALSDKVWYTRHLVFKSKKEEWNKTPKDIRSGAIKSAKEVEKKYGKKWLLDYKDDFEWGMINGKLAMLRWMIYGNEDDLNT